MSMTKRMMEAEQEARLAAEKAVCECYWNWDDKFEVLCEKHLAEYQEREDCRNAE